VFTAHHVLAALLVGALIGAAAAYYALSRREVERERLYVPEGYDVVPLPPQVFDVMVERAQRAVGGV